jgi:hypothetical protein
MADADDHCSLRHEIFRDCAVKLQHSATACSHRVALKVQRYCGSKDEQGSRPAYFVARGDARGQDGVPGSVAPRPE